jgi:hypothetical protein
MRRQATVDSAGHGDVESFGANVDIVSRNASRKNSMRPGNDLREYLVQPPCNEGGGMGAEGWEEAASRHCESLESGHGLLTRLEWSVQRTD